jgi:hypothetical protein
MVQNLPSTRSYRPRLECLEDRAVPSLTVLTALPNPSTAGQPIALTATVIETGTDNVPPGTGSRYQGTVTFFDGTTPLATVAVTNSGSPGHYATQGTAVFTTSSLTIGSRALTAQYSGDYDHDVLLFTTGSTSQLVNEVVGMPSGRVALDAFFTAAGLMTNTSYYWYAGVSDFLSLAKLASGSGQQQLNQAYYTAVFTDMFLLSAQL